MNSMRSTFYAFLIIIAASIFIYLISGIIAPFIAAAIIAYLLRPAVEYMNAQCKIHNAISSLIILSLFIFLVLLFFALLGPLIYKQGVSIVNQIDTHSDFLVSQSMSFITSFLEMFSPNIAEQIQASMSNISKQVMLFVGNLLQSLLKSGLMAVNTLSLIFITPVVAFYLLRDWDIAQKTTEWLIPSAWKSDYKKLLNELDIVIKSFFRGQLAVCGILAIYYTVGFLLAGLHSAVALGVLSGILVFIPYVGGLTSTILCFTIALLQFGFGYHISVLFGILLFGQVLEGMVITPKLIGDSVGLHPVWLIFSLLAAGALFGFLGVIVAVPVAAFIGVIIRFYLRKYKGEV